jgi:hypothetical protein
MTKAQEMFHAIVGDPRREDDKRTLVLPVKLEPGRTCAMCGPRSLIAHPWAQTATAARAPGS